MGAARTSTAVAVAWRREYWQVYQAEEEETGHLATAHLECSGVLENNYVSGLVLQTKNWVGPVVDLLIRRLRTSGW